MQYKRHLKKISEKSGEIKQINRMTKLIVLIIYIIFGKENIFIINTY